MNEKLKLKIENLPARPGVYMMLGEDGGVIYVGKAKTLSNRVRSYFQSPDAMPVKTARLVSHICDLNTIVTDSEAEALMLECNLIKRYKPFYNIMLRDDKTYPFIALTMSEPYPRVILTRRPAAKGDRVFGPFMNAGLAREVTEIINARYQLQKCKKGTRPGVRSGSVCLYHHMGQCPGCCTGKVDREAYLKTCAEAEQVLSGKTDPLTSMLKEEMEAHSGSLRFEEAARSRDALASVTSLFEERQKVISESLDDRDVIGIAFDGQEAAVQVFTVREGKMIGARSHEMRVSGESREDILHSFIAQHYASSPQVPSSVILPWMPSEPELLTEMLSLRRKGKVTFSVPVRGDRLRLLEMASRNASQTITNRRSRKENRERQLEGALAELASLTGAAGPCTRIESYDISNIASAYAVGAMTVYAAGKRAPQAGRKFRIKEVSGQNDIACMVEVIFRRLSRASEEERSASPNPSFLPPPDLILVDGGAAHVSAAAGVVSLFSWPIAVAGLAKGAGHKLRNLVTASGEQIPVTASLKCRLLLNSISEDVHAGAVGYHRKIRSKGMTDSRLTRIKGVGEKSASLLMSSFGSLEAISAADISALTAAGVNSRVARAVKEALSSDPPAEGCGG